MTDTSNPETILVINAGSSSLKCALYKADDMSLITSKNIAGIKNKEGYETATNEVLELIKTHNVVGVGHRVVHGGREFSAPVKIDDKVLEQLDALTPLAPLHEPHNLAPAKLIRKLYPDLPQVACFDTAFHRTEARLNQEYALPRELTDEGIIRYGFHGLSYEYISSVLPKVAGDKIAKGRIIVAHLGNGSSLCAMKDGKSVATTMGFTPGDGLMMGTRTGQIDPGIEDYLKAQKGLSDKEVSDIFNKQSGLKGVSGMTEDLRVLLASDKPEAKEAIDLYCLYAARHIASLTVDLGGLDGIVFTAGIGENSALIRKKICDNLAFLGIKLDAGHNEANGPSIQAEGSAVPVFVIKTNEELMMAQHTKALISAPSKPIAAPKTSL
jgi:acetate kinase